MYHCTALHPATTPCRKTTLIQFFVFYIRNGGDMVRRSIGQAFISSLRALERYAKHLITPLGPLSRQNSSYPARISAEACPQTRNIPDEMGLMLLDLVDILLIQFAFRFCQTEPSWRSRPALSLHVVVRMAGCCPAPILFQGRTASLPDRL